MICKYISERYLQYSIYLNGSSNEKVNSERIVNPSKSRAVAKLGVCVCVRPCVCELLPHS